MDDNIVTKFGKMWPREVWNVFKGNSLLINEFEELKHSGVYILYRDEMPYYIGKSTDTLYSRIHAHANISNDEYFQFWNYFSFFVIPDPAHVDEIEGLLIASLPSSNRAVRKIEQAKLPKEITKILRDERRIQA